MPASAAYGPASVTRAARRRAHIERRVLAPTAGDKPPGRQCGWAGGQVGHVAEAELPLVAAPPADDSTICHSERPKRPAAAISSVSSAITMIAPTVTSSTTVSAIRHNSSSETTRPALRAVGQLLIKPIANRGGRAGRAMTTASSAIRWAQASPSGLPKGSSSGSLVAGRAIDKEHTTAMPMAQIAPMAVSSLVQRRLTTQMMTAAIGAATVNRRADGASPGGRHLEVARGAHARKHAVSDTTGDVSYAACGHVAAHHPQATLASSPAIRALQKSCSASALRNSLTGRPSDRPGHGAPSQSRPNKDSSSSQ